MNGSNECRYSHLVQIVYLGKCHNGHAMKSVKGSERSSATCDFCYRPIKERSPGDTPVNYCTTCDFDVCSKCMSGASVGICEGSYVTVSANYKTHSDAAGGPLVPGRYGVVLRDDKSSKPFEVRQLNHFYPRTGCIPVYMAECDG